MSLLGALNLGQASLASQQMGLQVTGNNIANASTPGYTRQAVNLVSNGSTPIGNQLVGDGVTVGSVERQADEAVESSLRDANSSLQNSSTQDTYLGQIQSALGALDDNDLSSRMNDFFGNFQTLAQNPQDPSQRAIVIQGGVSLAGYIQGLRGQITGIRSNVDSQVSQLTSQANSYLKQISTLNQQITTSEASGGVANDLRDQRTQALSSLSQIANVSTSQQSNGQFNVSIGGISVVQGSEYRGLTTKLGSDPTGTMPVTSVVTADTGQPVSITGGSLGGLMAVRDTHLQNAITTLDTIASSLITSVNSIHSQGQGLTGFTDLTGATADKDPTLALNAPTTATGLPSVPVNGTFNLDVTDNTTGQVTTKQIKVDFSSATPTTLNSLAASINGGNISATVDSSGHLNIKSTNSNTSFTFSNDTSGVLAALGLNTFFTGSNAANIAMNQTLVQTPSYLAAGSTPSGQPINPGSNTNTIALSQALTNPNSTLGGQSIQSYYSTFVGQLGTTAAAAHDDASSQQVIHDTLFAQRESESGVSLDEEAINLTKYQRAFQGSAKFIAVVDEMMQTVLGLVS